MSVVEPLVPISKTDEKLLVRYTYSRSAATPRGPELNGGPPGAMSAKFTNPRNEGVAGLLIATIVPPWPGDQDPNAKSPTKATSRVCTLVNWPRIAGADGVARLTTRRP